MPAEVPSIDWAFEIKLFVIIVALLITIEPATMLLFEITALPPSIRILHEIALLEITGEPFKTYIVPMLMLLWLILTELLASMLVVSMTAFSIIEPELVCSFHPILDCEKAIVEK